MEFNLCWLIIYEYIEGRNFCSNKVRKFVVGFNGCKMRYYYFRGNIVNFLVINSVCFRGILL